MPACGSARSVGQRPQGRRPSARRARGRVFWMMVPGLLRSARNAKERVRGTSPLRTTKFRSLSMMELHVIGKGHDPEIIWPVVLSIAVDVVDAFIRSKPPTEKSFH